ncbi:3',5'-cyclic-AMP phosphodiesterase [Reinekea marinisedimentorum]|uniref:Icc protein n=1 Tax=Reinekea marinisedimentorum TaxID=230495 RepID=A0A4R3I7B6_9GAMM|nr:3',5'-cyclic-AMP phosphodiesterase [Reinekea marinisedimentorum]TCS41160.1 Icc protein [Reinekea marinisedimentorum]
MAQTFTLVQITDPHLHASPDGTLLGMNTENSLKLIVERIAQTVPKIDMILATGDIAQDSSVQAYKNFLSHIKPLKAPMRWIPGNHDSRENMAEACIGLDHSDPVVELGDWVIVLLDSIVPKKVYGELAPDQLELLENTLEQHKDRHVLLTFHHHPLDMECKWIDSIGIRNPEALHKVLSKYENVRATLFGHVHQDSDRVINGMRYISTPSTCVQFLPKSEDFGIDTLGPGYRTLTLLPNGDIETFVERVKGPEFEIDFSQKGY